jgi:hypothetical protein
MLNDCFDAPELEQRCVCITSDLILGALVSSFCALPGRYFPLFEFPLIDPETKPNSVEAMRARVGRVLINNAIARLQPERIVLAGLNPTQSAMFAYLPNQRVITLQSEDELGAKLAFLSRVHEGRLRCAPEDLARGVFCGARWAKRLVCDPTAKPLARDGHSAAQGIVVAERRDDLSDVIAANYAIAVNADFEVVEPFDHRESARINRLLVEWGESRSASAHAELTDEVKTRLGGIDFAGYEFATFFTRGLPYGFVLENAIPTSHVLSGVRDDHFIFNNIFLERSKTFFGSAVLFSPGAFEDEETKDVIQHFGNNNYIVRELTDRRATPGNLDTYASQYPYDVLHICSHGGETDGYHCIKEFKDRYGISHRVEFDEVVAFCPVYTEKDKVSVTQKEFPRRLDGFEWMSPELAAQKYPSYIFEDLWAALADDDAAQPVRTPATDAIAGSCCIVCTNGIHQGTFERLASDHFPFVFNNTCLSWREIAASFLDAGCRGYIGTLWPVGTHSASEAARMFYQYCWSQPIVKAFYEMSKSIDSLADKNVYLFWGLHFSSIYRPEQQSNERIVAQLMTASADWKGKLGRDDFPPRIRAKCVESLQQVLRLLFDEPGVRQFVERWFQDDLEAKPPRYEDDEPSKRRSIEISRAPQYTAEFRDLLV